MGNRRVSPWAAASADAAALFCGVKCLFRFGRVGPILVETAADRRPQFISNFNRKGESCVKRKSFLDMLMPPSERPQVTGQAPHEHEPRPTPAALPKKPTSSRRLGERLWEQCAELGDFTRLVGRFVGRRLHGLLAPARRGAARLGRYLFVRPVRAVQRELRQMRHGVTIGRERVVEAWHRHRVLGVLQALLLPALALRRHRRFLGLIFQGLMITVSSLLLVAVVRYWNGTAFALELTYNGEVLGYITDETVLTETMDMAEGRVIKVKNADTPVISHSAELRLKTTRQDSLLNEDELCDEMLLRCGSAVAQMSGLYVGGQFEGALETHEEVETLLADILALYDTEADTSYKVAEFRQTVEIRDGLYLANAGETYQTLWEHLTATDENGIPYLTVQIRCTEVYTEEIPFDKTTVVDSTKYIGYSAVRTAGVTGKKQVTADVVYLNGEEQYREILSEEVLSEPVTQVTAIGGYRVNAQAQPGVATGSFMWPVPSCRLISSGYAYRWGKLHAGLDISGNGVYGKDILASDGGTVYQVNTEGWGGGYGLYVIIDHGNGYQSVYCHCSEILVKPGQKVSQGELIAKIGNSGNSYGAHLHFEIRLNGRSVDPAPYL